MAIEILGIDLAKRVFQLHAADRHGRVVHRGKVSRAELRETVQKLSPRVIAMEACASAHYWARQLQAMGMEVRLISPQYVVPFVKTNKNDRNDAEAIVEAACRPTMRFVSVKSVEQQDVQAAHRVRELLVHQRTALINQMRGLLSERGIVIAKTPRALKRILPEILVQCDQELSALCRTLMMELLEQLRSVEERIAHVEKWIYSFMKHSPRCQKIAKVEGVGPVTATAVVGAVGTAKEFKNGRHFAAWIGLVPRQYSSGGKSRLQGISKRGDTYLRTLLIHGARAVLCRIAGKTDRRSRWLQELITRRGYNRAAVALANKNARIIQALLSHDGSYVPAQA